MANQSKQYLEGKNIEIPEINRQRRTLLQGTTFAFLPAIFFTKTRANNVVISEGSEENSLQLTSYPIENTNSEIEIGENQVLYIRLYTEAKVYIGKEQLDFFLQYHNIEQGNGIAFESQVYDLQMESGITLDGVLGPQTIKHFYRQIELSGDLSTFPIEIQERVRLYKMFSQYQNKAQRHPKGLKSIYGKTNYFYGEGVGENIKGYYINEQLFKELQSSGLLQTKSMYNGGNFIDIQKIGQKYYLALYAQGVLQVLTYVSPGAIYNDPYTGRSRKTVENVEYISSKIDKYHTSSAYPAGGGGAIMPYAYHIVGGIWGHAGDVNGYGLSHGCIRAPGFYQQRIYDILQSIGSKNFKVRIGDLY